MLLTAFVLLAAPAAQARPTVGGTTKDSAHFRVHHPTGVGLGPHADAALEGAERAYRRLVHGAGGTPNVGMRAPRSDAFSDPLDVPAADRDGLTDIYFEDLPGEGGAETVRDPRAPYAAWFSMDPDASTLHTEKGASHELMHVLQSAYRTPQEAGEGVSGWLTESTAAWAEELSTDDGPSLTNGLHDFRLPITCTRGSWDGRACGLGYGRWLFVAHLAQAIGHRVVPNAFARFEKDYCPPRCDGGMSGSDGLVHVEALEDELAAEGTSLAAEFRRYAWKVLDPTVWPAYVERILTAPGFPTAPGGITGAAVGPSVPDTGWRPATLDHLTARYAIVRRTARPTATGERVRLLLRGPADLLHAPRVLVRPDTATTARTALAMRRIATANGTSTWELVVPFAAHDAVDAAIALVNDTVHDDRAFAWRAIHVPAPPAPAPAPAPPAPAPAPAPAPVPLTPTVGGAALPPVEGAPGFLFPAKLRVSRAEVERSDRRLDVLAPITSRADGDVEVSFRAAGRTIEFDAPVRAADGAFDHVRFRERIPRAQARKGTGIVTISYPGSATTRPQEVRLRAARRKARLDVDRIRLDGAGLDVEGSVSSRASGVVRVEVSYQEASGAPRTWRAQTEIGDDGDWSLADAGVPPEVAAAGGYLSVLFTGDLEARMRGEMVSYAVQPGRTRTPD